MTRSIITSLVVGTIVCLGHSIVPATPWWTLIHGALPAFVFSYGAWSNGRPKLDIQLFLRGAATVGMVAIAFSVVNDVLSVPLWTKISLNYAIPFIVATVGAACARSARQVEPAL